MARPLAYVTVFTGLRASKTLSPAWRAIDLKAGTIKVVQRADSKNVIGPPKTEAGRRTIPLPPTLMSVLREWKLRCPPSEGQFVFPSDAGTPIFYPRLMT